MPIGRPHPSLYQANNKSTIKHKKSIIVENMISVLNYSILKRLLKAITG